MWQKVGSVEASPLKDLAEGGHLMLEVDIAVHTSQDVPITNQLPPAEGVSTPEVRTQLKKQLLIAKLKGAWVVTSNSCPHAYLPLHEGELKAGCITCPFHGYTYNLKSGINIDMPDETELPVYQTRIVKGQLEVDLV